MWVAFDTETTGLVDNLSKPERLQPEIIEFYACVFCPRTGAVTRELNTLVRPSRPVPEEITRITSITPAMVAGLDVPTFAEIADSVEQVLNAGEALVAHNLSFDLDMLELEFSRLGRKLNLRARRLCTVEQSVAEKGYRLSLEALHEHLFGEGFPEAHRAKNDVEAMVRCVVEMHKRELVA